MEKSTKPVILLVDDQDEILEFIADDLSDKYQVLTARNGLEAMETLENKTIQLIISDVMMPVMDGFQFCNRIKTSEVWSHIPVILLTAKNTMQAKLHGLEIGADAYVEKPFSPAYLQAQIHCLLENRIKIKTYFSNSPLLHLRNGAYGKGDELFLEKLQHTIDQNLTNNQLDVEHLAEQMNMSRPTLYRKIKSISDLSPNELITTTRLKRAAELLHEGDYKVYEIAEMVGCNSTTNFGRMFTKQFGMPPTQYMNSKLAERKA